jgi:hypothetical protein
VPKGPFTVKIPPEYDASVLVGITIGFFAIRDMLFNVKLKNDDENNEKP